MRNGSEVAVKVQRPGIRKIIQNDLETFKGLASIIDNHTSFGAEITLQQTFLFMMNGKEKRKSRKSEISVIVT